MKLRVILSKEVNTALKAPKRPDRTVDMQMVEDIIKDFFLYGWYVQELIFDSEEMRNFDNIVDAFKNTSIMRSFHARLFKEGGEFFLGMTAFRFLKSNITEKRYGEKGKSASPRNRRREKNLLYYEGGESYGIPSGKERQTARYLPENAVRRRIQRFGC